MQIKSEQKVSKANSHRVSYVYFCGCLYMYNAKSISLVRNILYRFGGYGIWLVVCASCVVENDHRHTKHSIACHYHATAPIHPRALLCVCAPTSDVSHSKFETIEESAATYYLVAERRRTKESSKMP